MKTILGTEILEEVRGIVYICDYTYNKEESTLKVIHEILFKNVFDALEAYAGIPNPESQIAVGSSFEELIVELTDLHTYMSDSKWLEELNDYL